MHRPSRKYLQMCLPLCSTVCWLMNSWLMIGRFFWKLGGPLDSCYKTNEDSKHEYPEILLVMVQSKVRNSHPISSTLLSSSTTTSAPVLALLFLIFVGHSSSPANGTTTSTALPTNYITSKRKSHIKCKIMGSACWAFKLITMQTSIIFWSKQTYTAAAAAVVFVVPS